MKGQILTVKEIEIKAREVDLIPERMVTTKKENLKEAVVAKIQ